VKLLLVEYTKLRSGAGVQVSDTTDADSSFKAGFKE